MKSLSYILLILLTLNSCIVKFIPEISEDKELLVVQGLITDQQETDTIKLSKSLPLGQKIDARPVTGSTVSISDDQGGIVYLSEVKEGTYITPSYFKGVTGRFYTLHIAYNNLSFESSPMEMKPVPPVDSVYYEKVNVEPPFMYFKGVDACQIYLDTHDPSNNCKYFRWDFTETWVLRLLWPVENQTCWITDKSRNINIKSTVAFDESRVKKLPVNYITNLTDRLQTKYSILVNQYSLNEDEYNYWSKIQNINVQVGGLYDVIPASVPSNIICIENPDEKVLGYFSVSAKSSKRIFIKDTFEGLVNLYPDCPTDTIPYIDPPGLGVTVWVLYDSEFSIPPFKILTDKKGCADCTVRGTNIKPDFWKDDK